MANKKRKRAANRIRADTASETGKTVAYTTMPLWEDMLTFGYRPLWDCPEVRMCVSAYADLISNMTIHLMQNTDRGDVRVQNGLSRLVDIEPCDHMTRKAWVWNIVNIMLTVGEGNAVVYPEYDAGGFIRRLVPLSPYDVSFREVGDTYCIDYRGTVLTPEEVLHFAINPSPDKPWLGTGFRVSLRDVVGSIRQSAATRTALLENPAPSLLVRVSGMSDDFDSAAGRDRMADKYLSQTGTGKPWIIMEDLMDVQQVKPLTMTDLAIRDNVELDKRTIAGIFQVPPYMVGLGAYDKAAHENFINTQLMGIAQCIQQTLTRGLLYAPDLYWKFNPRSLYNYSLSELITAGAEMVDRMAMRRNEWRDWVGLSPDPDMEELLALENYIPADKLGDQKKLNDVGGENDGA